MNDRRPDSEKPKVRKGTIIGGLPDGRATLPKKPLTENQRLAIVKRQKAAKAKKGG